jgi:exopolysaccharide/PEP-CTERM locus tyrosine autokinase
LGKIFTALEKYLKENTEPLAAEPLQPEDGEALLQYNRLTEMLNIDSRQVIKDSSTVERLIANRLILPNGKLTPKGKQKYEELILSRRVAMAGQLEAPAEGAGAVDAGIMRPVPSDDGDRESLMHRDRMDGALPKSHLRANDHEALNRSVTADGAGPSRTPPLEPVPSGGKLIIKEPQERRRSTVGQTLESIAAGTSGTPALMDNRFAAKVAEDVPDRDKKLLLEGFLESPHPAPTAVAPLKPAPKPATSLKTTPVGLRTEGATIDPNLVSLLTPQSFMAERFKILRTNLLYPVKGSPPRSVLVTSVKPGDGKSFVAANLAVSVAMNINRHVLLMDCDLRRPTIHTQFGFGSCAGLSEFLSQGASLNNLLRQTKIDRLAILTGGNPPLNPSELLSSNRMKELLQEVTERYHDRLTIIDAPPPSLTSEAGVLARMVEGVILVVRHGDTSREELKSLIDQIGKEKVVGVVLNFFDQPSIGSKGYKYYRKYGDYTHP